MFNEALSFFLGLILGGWVGFVISGIFLSMKTIDE